MSDHKRTWPAPAAIAACALPFLIAFAHAAYFYRLDSTSLGMGLPIDDGYIFMRYAENIAAGHGFSFNPGPQ